MRIARECDESSTPKRRFVVDTVGQHEGPLSVLEARGIPAIGEEWEPYSLECISRDATVNSTGTQYLVTCIYGPTPPAKGA